MTQKEMTGLLLVVLFQAVFGLLPSQHGEAKNEEKLSVATGTKPEGIYGLLELTA